MSKRAEEYAVKIHDTAIKEGEKYANSHGESIIEAICYGRGFKAGCIQGYEQAEKDLGWHSVEESLPPIDEEVIVLTNRVRDIELDSANRICFAHIVDRSLAIDWGGWNIPGVKYWMPMPKLKEEVEEE